MNGKGGEFYETTGNFRRQKDFYQNLYFNHTYIDETQVRDVLGENINKLSDEKNSFNGRRNFLYRNSKRPLKYEI